MRNMSFKLGFILGLFLLPFSSVMAEKTTGYWQEMTEKVQLNTGTPRTGQEVYDYRCGSCHERSTQGAPLLDDDYEWYQRVQKGTEALMKQVLNGTKNTLMPARGGCENCTNRELYNAMVFMLKSSKIPFEPLPFATLKLK